ncbi:hypothetical protein D3C87_1554010 [compost metagenome]
MVQKDFFEGSDAQVWHTQCPEGNMIINDFFLALDYPPTNEGSGYFFYRRNLLAVPFKKDI